MSIENILLSLKKKEFKPVYWLEGEESYFIDEIVNYVEHQILSPAEASFNLTVFYGRDAVWSDVVNACKRYPMNAEKQIVLLKEAQTMKDIERLETYITKPSDKTIFVVSYKEKKLDGKTKFAKKVKDNAVVLTTKKLYENQVGEWITSIVKSFNVSITPKASVLLVHQIGNDLSRLKNEIEKIVVNLDSKRNISEDEIEKFIGISKEYNVFELQDALAQKNLIKAIRISQYFAANPKAAPIQMILPALYGFFSKVYMVFGAGSNDERAITSAIGVAPFQVRNFIQAASNYGLNGIEGIMLLLHEYNLRSIGVDDSVTSDANLLKEMIVRIIG